MNDLVEYLTAAVESGAIPSPISGEAMDSYQLRAAHAGAVIGARWYADRSAALQRDAEQAVAAAADEPVPQREQLDLDSVRD